VRPAGWRLAGDLGELPVNTSQEAYANAVKPDFGSDWLLRFQDPIPVPEVGGHDAEQ
jgi:hypothetical protein